jgi:hypothetical protein
LKKNLWLISRKLIRKETGVKRILETIAFLNHLTKNKNNFAKYLLYNGITT